MIPPAKNLNVALLRPISPIAVINGQLPTTICSISRRAAAAKNQFASVHVCSLRAVFEATDMVNSHEQTRTVLSNCGTETNAHQRFYSRPIACCKCFLIRKLHDKRWLTKISAGFWRESPGSKHRSNVRHKNKQNICSKQ